MYYHLFNHIAIKHIAEISQFIGHTAYCSMNLYIGEFVENVRVIRMMRIFHHYYYTDSVDRCDEKFFQSDR